MLAVYFILCNCYASVAKLREVCNLNVLPKVCGTKFQVNYYVLLLKLLLLQTLYCLSVAY